MKLPLQLPWEMAQQRWAAILNPILNSGFSVSNVFIATDTDAPGTVGTASSTYIFKTSVMDPTGSYSTSTGIFKSPATGFGLFSWHARTASVNLATTDRFLTFLAVNGSTAADGARTIGSGGGSVPYTSGGVAIVPIRSGDQVSVQMASSVSTLLASGTGFNYFAGMWVTQ